MRSWKKSVRVSLATIISIACCLLFALYVAKEWKRLVRENDAEIPDVKRRGLVLSRQLRSLAIEATDPRRTYAVVSIYSNEFEARVHSVVRDLAERGQTTSFFRTNNVYPNSTNVLIQMAIELERMASNLE